MLEIFEILLSAERSTPERLEALDTLRPFLETEAAVNKLADAAREEAVTAVRAAMLELLCTVDITRINNRDAFLNSLAYFAGMEPERELRWMAVNRLAVIGAHDEQVQEILAETMAQDIDPAIQLACIGGLRNCVRKTPATVALIRSYIPVAPDACRPGLLELVQQLEREDAQQLTAAFLEPWEYPGTQLMALRFLAAFPSLGPDTVEKLLAHFQATSRPDLRIAVTDILSRLTEVDPAVFRLMLQALERLPDQPELLRVIAGRLTANPQLQEEIAALFRQTPSAGLKQRLLDLLRDSHADALLMEALQDANPWLRQYAIGFIPALLAREPEAVEAVLINAISRERTAALRMQLLGIFLHHGRKSAAATQFITEWATRETDPVMQAQLAAVATGFPVTEENRSTLLRLFRQVLEGAFFPAGLKQQVAERIQAFAYKDEPELKACLAALLENATDVREVNMLYERLKTQEADLNQLAPSLIRILYRYIDYYPQQPFDDWVKMLGRLAAVNEQVRRELPYIISLTGATWLLGETDRETQTGAFLPAYQQAMQNRNATMAQIEASRLLREAWQQRTLKKAEVIALYKILLQQPKEYGMLQQLLDIMAEGKLVTPELLDLSLDFLLKAIPDNNRDYAVRKYLEKTGHLDAGYREKLAAAFTQEHYDIFCRRNLPVLYGRRLPASFDDWDYTGWLCPYPTWSIAELYFAAEPGETFFQWLAEGPENGTGPVRSLQYLALEHLWREQRGKWAQQINSSAAQMGKLLQALYALYSKLPGDNKLGDRALLLFWRKWPDYRRLLNGQPVPAPFADAAAMAYTAICRKQSAFDPELKTKKFPTPMEGMSPAMVKEHWVWDQPLWEAFEARYFRKTH